VVTLAQDRESLPAETSVPTTVLRRHHTCAVCTYIKLKGLHIGISFVY